jgi:hypothetical protein
MGLAFDLYRSYRPTFLVFEVALLLAIVLALRLGPYAYPARPVAEQGGLPQPID